MGASEKQKPRWYWSGVMPLDGMEDDSRLIGPEARDVGQPFDTYPVRLNRHPLRRLDMYGMKSLLSAFDVKADRIDRRVGAGQHIGNPPLVSNVGLDRLKTRIIGTEKFATAVRMP